jgi:hypothetical protein
VWKFSLLPSTNLVPHNLEKISTHRFIWLSSQVGENYVSSCIDSNGPKFLDIQLMEFLGLQILQLWNLNNN